MVWEGRNRKVPPYPDFPTWRNPHVRTYRVRICSSGERYPVQRRHRETAGSLTKKLAACKSRNGVGPLVRKQPPRERATSSSPAHFTLHEGDFGQGGIIVVSVRRTWSVESDLRFEIVERPTIGMVRVLQELGDSPELLYLAKDREAAERLLASN